MERLAHKEITPKFRERFRTALSTLTEEIHRISDRLGNRPKPAFAYASIPRPKVKEKKEDQGKMRFDIAEVTGFAAAVVSSIQFIPQVLKTWRTKSTRDLSWGSLGLLATSISLWTAYGFMLASGPILATQVVTGICIASLIYLKSKEKN